MIRRADAGSAGKVSLALVAALVLVLAFAVAVSATPAEPLAPQIPNLPHYFYGYVTTDLGTPLPGMLVTAQAVTGSWTGASATTTDSMSKYGYGPSFYVPAWDSGGGAGAKNGDKIAFFVNGQPALLYDVLAGTTSTTYTFVSGGSTKLNLIVNLQYKITATADPNGSITPAGQVMVKYGTSRTFTITPDPGYLILDVRVDGVSNPDAVATGSYTFTSVTRDHTIHATFVRETYYIAVNAGVGCTITPPGPQVEVLYKQSITFNIAANTGYDLINVTVDGASKGAIPSFVFNDVVADHTIAATCKLKDLKITPFWGSGGSIIPGTQQTVSYGGSVTFEIKPDTGYVIDNVVVNGVSQGPTASYTFTNVTTDGTIQATFKVATFTITPTAGAHGTITPGTQQIVNYGGSATFTIAPNTGFVIDDVLVDGVSNPAAVTAGSFTFSNVMANHTIAATFKVATFVITPTAGAGGTITPGTPQTVNYGGSATFTDRAEHGLRDRRRAGGRGVEPRCRDRRQFHLQQRDGEPHHRSHLQGGDVRHHADGRCRRHDHAGHAADGELRRQRHLHDRAEHGLRDRRREGGRGVEPRCRDRRQLHLQQCDGEPHHRSHVQGGDIRDHADGRCARHDHAGHAADGELRRHPHLHDRGRHGLQHR